MSSAQSRKKAMGKERKSNKETKKAKKNKRGRIGE